MVRAAWRGAADADLVLLVVDAHLRPVDDDTARIIAGLVKAGRRAVLVVNKIDLVRRDRLLEITDRLIQAGGGADGLFTDTFMISAWTGDGVGDLRRFLTRAVPAGPWLYPEDQLTDMPERLLAAELTREQLFLQLHEELPYSVAVETEGWERFRDGSVRIDQVIYVLSCSAAAAPGSRRSARRRGPSSRPCSAAACTCSSTSRSARTGSTAPTTTASWGSSTSREPAVSAGPRGAILL
jgi:GTP-binding protein Era